MFLFIGAPEVLIILLFVVIFFGSKKIPGLAKGLGKAMRELKDASDDIKKEIRDSASSVKDDLNPNK
jgi:sec-independent protein translocase protein TatA